MVTFSVRLLVRQSVQLRIDEIIGEIGLELNKNKSASESFKTDCFYFLPGSRRDMFSK